MENTENYYAPDLDPADSIKLAEAVKRLNDEVKEGDKIMRELAAILMAYLPEGIDPSGMDLYDMAKTVVREIAKQKALVTILKRNLDSKTHECEALRKSLEAAQSRGDDRPIAGYYVIDRPMPDADTLDEAMELAMLNVREGGDSQLVLEVRLIGTAKRSAEWVPA